jgi:hypothetical protein
MRKPTADVKRNLQLCYTAGHGAIGEDSSRAGPARRTGESRQNESGESGSERRERETRRPAAEEDGEEAMNNDRPLATQTAAPPVVPPRRPLVGLGLTDDPDDFQARVRAQLRDLEESRRRIDEIIAANQVARARLDEWQARLNTRLNPESPPDA